MSVCPPKQTGTFVKKIMTSEDGLPYLLLMGGPVMNPMPPLLLINRWAADSGLRAAARKWAGPKGP